jgi:mono/diheme cytochrome c family protein
VAYISSMPAPPRRVPSDPAKVQRGREIFASEKAACSSCHSGAAFTDGETHDVGSQHRGDRRAAFGTPSLHGVSGTGPFFHDGRYQTLAELLRDPDGKMGNTQHLSSADIEALQSYLETL